MKINGWVKIGSLLVMSLISMMSFSRALAFVGETDASITQMEKFSDKLKINAEAHEATRWVELEQFQNKLYRAMALDPVAGMQVPIAQVPKHLFSAELSSDLFNSWSELKKSSIPADTQTQAEFGEYAKAVEQILTYRTEHKLPLARAIAKRGTLENRYAELVAKFTKSNNPSTALIQEFDGITGAVKEELNASKNKEKKELFGGGGKFVWFALVMIVGFFLGIATYRSNSDAFQSLLGAKEKTGRKLDYVGWLKDFEQILTRLRSSQLTHDRRIQELVMNSEKINQYANALYSDARIKNEANLEHRMSSLIKEIQQQMDQGQKLQAGEKAQVQTMLEHCLMLCDAVENQAVKIDASRLNH